MTVMVTRRSLLRTHLFRPDPEVTQLFVYCLCVTAKRHDILVHAAVLMSTHEHLVVTDSRGKLPDFLRELHRLFALGVKALRRWDGAVWDHERPSVVHLRTQHAVIEKLAYIMANPVAAGLVPAAEQWPGLHTRPQQLGRGRLRAKRPDVFFAKDSPLWPADASIDLTLPELADMCPAELREAVAHALEDHVRAVRAENQRAGRGFVGAHRILASSPYARARSWEPLRKRNPCFAVGRNQVDAFREAARAVRAFRRAYHAALERWRNGVRSVCFPAGTWFMRVFHAARTASPA